MPLPAGTPTFTRTRSAISATARARAFRAAQIVIAAVVLWFAYRTLRAGWTEFRRQPVLVHPHWGWIALSAMTFLAAYVVLIETWRAVVGTWGRAVPFGSAARIWTVSNLGRYVPGKLWQIAAMGMLAQRAGVSPVAATGSAVLSTVVNIATGFLVVMATGWRLLELPYAGASAVAAAIIILTVLGFIAVPWAAPRAFRVAERMTGRPSQLTVPPRRAVAHAVVGNVVAWVLYGLAFKLLAQGVLGDAPGHLSSYVAVYTLSYLVGYLVLPAPAGVGFREASMITVMPAAGLGTAAQAAVLAVASRLCLTVLDIVPGLAFLARDTLRRASRAP